jgi:hypothetical protein
MEEKFRRRKLCIAMSMILACILALSLPPITKAYSNGGYSADPSNPDYGTHDYIAQHALDWLPMNEKRYIAPDEREAIHLRPPQRLPVRLRAPGQRRTSGPAMTIHTGHQHNLPRAWEQEK